MHEYNQIYSNFNSFNNFETYHFSLLRMMFETSKRRVTFLSLVFFVKSLMLQQGTVFQHKINYISVK